MDSPAGATAGVGARAIRGVVWSYVSLAGVRLLVLVWTAVLARLLAPREFGLVALALIFTTIFDAVRDVGVNQALVVAGRDDVDRQAQTAFRFSLLLALGLAAAAAAVSPSAAHFFHQPQLLALLAVLGLNLPLRSLGLTHYSLAQRNLDFRSRTVAELAEVLVRGAVGITLAAGGSGPWSLVLGYLAGTATWSAALWLLVDWRPSPRAPRAPLPPLMRFGGALTGVSFIGVVMSYADNFFVGRVLGTAALGLYTLGYRLPEMLVVEVAAAAGLVMFPAFALLEGAALPPGPDRHVALLDADHAAARGGALHARSPARPRAVRAALARRRAGRADPQHRLHGRPDRPGVRQRVHGHQARGRDAQARDSPGDPADRAAGDLRPPRHSGGGGLPGRGQVAVRADRPLRLHARARPEGERALERVLAGDRRHAPGWRP